MDDLKIATIYSVIHSVNIRCEPRPTRKIPHFTERTYKLLEELRMNKPPESEPFYDMNQLFNFMQEKQENSCKISNSIHSTNHN